MFIKAYYARGQGTYDQLRGQKESIFINNFGYFRNVEEDIPTHRPLGRKDYHIIYVSSGELTVGERKLTDGEFYIFFPNSPQNYTYLPREHTLYYWCHFTGNSIPTLLEENGLLEGAFKIHGRKHEVDTLFSLLNDATNHDGALNSQYQRALLLSIILLLSEPAEPVYPFRRAIAILEDISRDISVNELADIYKVSVPHFIRKFKETYGNTPMQYRICCQLTQAQNLLLDTSLPLSVIAEECGFTDPFYFSRLFKRHIGVSPSHFRKSNGVNI